MKKQLLIFSLMLVSAAATAQWTVFPSTGTATGLAFDGETAGTSGEAGSWGSFVPAHTDATCSSAGPPGGISFIPGASGSGEVGFGIGTIANGYQDFGGGCVSVFSNIGFTSSTTLGDFHGTSGIDVDLSAPANMRIKFSYKCNSAVTLYLQLSDQWGNSQLTNASISLLGDDAWHDVDFDFSSYTPAGHPEYLASIRLFSFEYRSTTPYTGNIYFKQLSIGSATTASNNAALANVLSAGVYPNPAQNNLTVDLSLAQTSNVKVVVSDMYGRSLVEMPEQYTNQYKNNLDVSSLKNGMYTVTYYLDGAPVKSELLSVAK